MGMSTNKNKNEKMAFGANGIGLIDLDGIEQNLEMSYEPMPIMNTICGANSELVFSEAN